MDNKIEHDMRWICDKCKEKLVLSNVKVAYLGGNFEVEL